MSKEKRNEVSTLDVVCERMSQAKRALIEMKKLEAEFKRLKKKRKATVTVEPVINGHKTKYRRV